MHVSEGAADMVAESAVDEIGPVERSKPAASITMSVFRKEGGPLTKRIPDSVAERVREEGFEAVIAEVAPEIATAARMWRPSTSSGIRNPETGEVFEKDGGHLYIGVVDAADSHDAGRNHPQALRRDRPFHL